MSRKKTQPKKIITPDPIFKSTIIPKLINSIMYDGKKLLQKKLSTKQLKKLNQKQKKSQLMFLMKQ